MKGDEAFKRSVREIAEILRGKGESEQESYNRILAQSEVLRKRFRRGIGLLQGECKRDG